MRRISFTAALTIAAALALTGGTAAAAPKDPGLGDRVDIRIQKNGKLRTEDGLKVAYVKISYRCAPAPNLQLVANDVTISQRLPGSDPTGAPGGYVMGSDLRCTGRWRNATVTAEATWWAGGPAFQKGPVEVSLFLIFSDMTSAERFGQASGTAVLR